LADSVIRVLGFGGGGTNTVNRMIDAGVEGVELITVNTDVQALRNSAAGHSLAIGQKMTQGLGTGGEPGLGRKAAEASAEEIRHLVQGADLVFITAGLGGGTGTGAAPVAARIAREEQVLTIGVVTTPFTFEGSRRSRIAETGVELLRQQADSVIVVSNDRLLALGDPHLSLVEGFRLADDTLRQAIQGIADLVTVSGVINVDFADVRAIMAGAGSALIAIGQGNGPGRARHAAEEAIASPLLETSIEGAQGILVNITGTPDVTLLEIHEVAQVIHDLAGADPNIILGIVVTPNSRPEFKIILIATGAPRRLAPPARSS
jgi:cell division protein FtsZ